MEYSSFNQAILDNLLEGFQVIDFNWRYVYVNETVAKQGQNTIQNLIGKTMMECYPGIEKSDMFIKLEQCMNERVPLQYENRFVNLDGSVQWFELRMEPTEVGIIVLSSDCTNRKMAELELLQLKENLEIQVEQRTQELEKSLDLLSEQHALVSEQKSQIERILFELTDSIRYALRIQNAVLPNEQTIRGTVPGDFFVIYKPKDIVSGDFFFVDRKGDWTLIAVADCTGHGVPGAFVSMLCIGLLNDIVKQKDVERADLILNELRDKVIDSLQQKGADGEQMDGMDISLLLINNETYQCHWSGANNPLYFVSSREKNLIELKPDKQPISIYPEMKAFTNHELVANEGDVFYLFTDGYSDQFGGEKGKKFMSRNFKKLLMEHVHKSMKEQGEILNSTIENWKSGIDGGFEQVDDITILGIRIG